MSANDFRVYPADQRPDIEVRIEDEGGELWVQGEVRSWSRSPDGSWWANCSYRRAPGDTHLDTFPADNVRPDTIDRAPGR